MSLTLAFLGDFGGGLKFIFQERESVGGGVNIGGLGEIKDLTLTHLKLSGAAFLIAAVITTPIGLYLGHLGRGQFAVSALSNVGRAVPIIALIAFFIAFFGVGFTNVMIALILLAIPPIFTNAYTGASQVDSEVVDAARGMGMTDSQIIRKVRLPLALPTYFGGLRIAAVSVLATATVASIANVQTLGEPITSLPVYGLQGAIGAAIVVAVLTAVLDAAMGGLERAGTPRGIKLAQGGGTSRGRFSMRKPKWRDSQ